MERLDSINYAELHKIISENFNLEPVAKIEKTENGSGNTYYIETTNKKFVAKVDERIDYVNAYEKVQHTLNRVNLLQSRIIRTNDGSLATPQGLVLYEFIEGSNYRVLNRSQCKNAVNYIREYNKALRLVLFKNEELDSKSYWDKSKSLDFLVYEFPGYIAKSDAGIENKRIVYDAAGILSENEEQLSKLTRQLIHSDLGPDNFVFNGDEVVCAIDFTPQYGHELYSLCQFIYWTYLWHSEDIDMDEIYNYLRTYISNGDINCVKDVFCLLLVSAALYRIAGSFMENFSRGARDYSGLNKRFSILGGLLAKQDRYNT